MVDLCLRRSSVVLVVCLLALGAGCGDDKASQQSTGPFAIGTRSLTFVDDARETPAFKDRPAEPTRTVVTDIWYPAGGDPAAAPAADAPAADGPFPLIVFNHGQQGEPQQYALSLEMWTRAGYVVAAPRHPLTVKGGPGAQFAHDIPGVIGDIPFVITSMGDELGDLVDLENVAVAGHSSGAIAAYAVGFNTCCADDRVDAVLVESLRKIPLEGEYSAELKGTPVMFLHGTADTNPIEEVRAEFEAAGTPKHLVAIEGGSHSDAFRVGPEAELAAEAALAFFDLSLKDRDGALAAIQALPGAESVPE